MLSVARHSLTARSAAGRFLLCATPLPLLAVGQPLSIQHTHGPTPTHEHVVSLAQVSQGTGSHLVGHPVHHGHGSCIEVGDDRHGSQPVIEGVRLTGEGALLAAGSPDRCVRRLALQLSREVLALLPSQRLLPGFEEGGPASAFRPAERAGDQCRSTTAALLATIHRLLL